MASNNVWMDDGQQQNNWYSNQNQGQGQDMGWGQFDYSQPQQTTNTAATGNDYYQMNQAQFQQPQSNNYNYYGGQMFVPNSGIGAVQSDGEDYENEPPLLEELGINFSHIKEKTFAVLNPTGTATAEVIEDQDLAGPLVFCLIFGAALLLHGKMSFGFIYGIGGLGCVGMYALMNLMAAEKSISFTCTASVLGYCLLPMALLSIVTAILSFKGTIGYLISALAVFWCSSASSKLFVIALSMDHQRLLKMTIKMEKQEQEEAWIVKPVPGYVCKWKNVKIDSIGGEESRKCFVNVCHCQQIPPPITDLNEEELAAKLDSGDNSYRIPICIGDLECIRDKKDENAIKHCINLDPMASITLKNRTVVGEIEAFRLKKSPEQRVVEEIAEEGNSTLENPSSTQREKSENSEISKEAHENPTEVNIDTNRGSSR
ncbi:unnamed protein product [Caenorhabditis bovis]|uniref:Yip1 domain-containing protein n=1 Tax=Caenorhabditis bovis TaxID=2654633 RepID=A0A8S1E2D9_9PELO|nr:unnamed protein product [Caenorhabditis bovis]